MVSFYIGNTDLTVYVDLQNYDVNLIEQYESWFDGNGNEHRNIYAEKAAGSLRVGFKTDAEISAFKEVLEESRNVDGYYPVTTSVNNATGLREYNAFINISAEGKYDVLNEREWIVFSLEIQER